MQEANPSSRSISNPVHAAIRRILCVLAPVMYVQGQPAHAACAPDATPGNDTIVCTATTDEAVDAGEGNDTVTSQGTLQASDVASDSARPQPPSFDEFESGTADYLIDSASTAIDGGAGNDTLDNTGFVSSSATTDLALLSLPLTLAGGQDVSATTTVAAVATGIAGGAGGDRITSSGRVDATADSVLASENVEFNGADTTHGDTTTTVSARARGIDAGEGSGDSVANSGEVNVAARVASATSNTEVDIVDAALADSQLVVEAEASALVAGTGGGSLDNSGSLEVLAAARSEDVSATMTYLDITLIETELTDSPADTGTTVTASGTGLDGAAATTSVALGNSGTIDVTATSNLDALAISLASEGAPAGLSPVIDELMGDAPVANIGIRAGSRAAGATGGQEADTATNSGTISVDATSRARQGSINVGMALIDWGVPTPGIVIGGAGTRAAADGIGMDGGQGDDVITNDALVDSAANASAGALTVSANISGFSDNPAGGGSSPLGSLAFSVAVADTKSLAQADAVGLRGGGGNDAVTNAGELIADADAEGLAIGVSASINVEFDQGENMLGANAVAARAGSFAEATAIGIDGGVANHRRGDHVSQVVVVTEDDDEITNSGTIEASADSRAVAVTASIVVAGTVQGAGVIANLAAADASADSYSTAIGVDAGGGDDAVINTGSIVADAGSEALSVGVGLSVGFASQGAVAGVSLARAEGHAESLATGVLGGAGLDRLANEGQIDAHAGATATAVSVSVGLTGTKDGLSISGALSDSSGDAIAAARGMDGGADDDHLRNDGDIAVSNVSADATAAAVSVSLAGVNNGVAISGSLAQTSANATAIAAGLEGGAGNDVLGNAGTITLEHIDAHTNAQSISVAMSGALTGGVTLAVSITDSSATAAVQAAGMSGGTGDDTLINSGTITAVNGIGTDAVAGSTSVSLSASYQGAALGAALSDASATADTRLTGIDGGDGTDHIENTGAIDLTGTATTGATSVSVSVTAAMGVAGGVALTDAQSSANAMVAGIDAGGGASTIMNSATLDIESRADADALGLSVGVSLGLGGDATVADGSASSTASAAGIREGGAAGARSDILNTGRLEVDSHASTEGRAISASLDGYSLGETSTTSLALVHGIEGGLGATHIENRGVIDASSTALADGWSLAVSGAGKVVGEAGVAAEAGATGIGSGDGDDVIQNLAAIFLDASSTADAVSIAAQLAGSAQANVRADAITAATGLDGGAGDDLITSSATMEVRATSISDAEGITVTVASDNGADAMNAPSSRAVVIAGGDGNDSVLLEGASVIVAATSGSTISLSNWNLAGATSSRAGAESTAVALALEGDAGDDLLQQQAGFLSIEATAGASATNSGWTFAGDVGTEAALIAVARTTAIDGGAGADRIGNGTAFTATSRATLDSSGGGNVVFGNAGANTEMGATAIATGVDGGADDDLIENAGAMTLHAESTVTSARSSYTFAGGASIDELLTSRAELVGLAGGDGNDSITNTAQVNGTALASATTLGGASTGLGGGAGAAGRAHTEAFAAGIAGGSGDDTIDNQGNLYIAATLAPVASNSSNSGTFFGNASVDARVNGEADAAGIDGGDGNDHITNASTLTVQASSTLLAQSYSSADGSEFSFGTAGNGVSHAEILLQGRAGGIRAGNGDDTVLNSGDISVQLQNLVARAETHASSGDTSGYGLGNANATVDARGAGVELGDGLNHLENDGLITVDASAFVWGLTGVGAVSFYNGNSTINATATGEGRGIVAGNGNHVVLNRGDVRITAAPIAESHASVDSGNDSGDAIGTTNTTATGRGWGIQTGDGDTHIENSGLLSVVADAQVRAPDSHGNMNVFAYGDHPDLDTTHGDADAYVRAMATGEAHGIRVGTGTHFIDNSGTISVRANPFAEGGYDVNPGNGVDGHAHTDTRLHALGSATGIAFAGGNAVIQNSGDITATAQPLASMAHNWGDGGPWQYWESWGSATGISGGQGDQSVINDGTITAIADGNAHGINDGRLMNFFEWAPMRARGMPEATGVSLQGAGYKSVVNNGTIDVSASSFSTLVAGPGIAHGVLVSGDGASVTNNGTITARANWLNAGTDTGVAIHMSSRGGQDLVLSLGRESVTNGRVVMTGGAATLMLEGNPLLNGPLVLDAARDFGLVLNDDGFFGHALPTVASVTKNGAGTYALPTLNTVGTMTLNGGTLELAGGYSFSPTGTLYAPIRGDGGHGTFSAAGVVALDGTLSVVGANDLYADGTRYRIITAGSLVAGSEFDTVQLPAASALVSFATERSATAFDVVAHVSSFESAAGGATPRAIASALDAAAPGSTGAMREHLVAIQQLGPEELQATYLSLNPVPYEFLSAAATSNASQFADALWQRMSDPGFLPQSVELQRVGAGRSAAGVRAARGQPVARQLGVWMRGFGRKGEQDARGTHAGHDYEQGGLAIGYDRFVGRYTIGASLGFVNHRLDAADDPGRSRVDSTLYSLYGGYSDQRRFVDALVTYGRNDYHLARRIVIGEFDSGVTGSRSGETMSVGFSGGTLHESHGWSFGPVANLQYVRLGEPGIAEQGGPLALEIRARTTHTLAGSLGARLGRSIRAGVGEWIPEVSVAWRHDRALGDRAIEASFAGAPEAAFSIAEHAVPRDGVLTGAGITWRSGGFAARLNWSGEFRGGQSTQGLFAGIRYML